MEIANTEIRKGQKQFQQIESTFPVEVLDQSLTPYDMNHDIEEKSMELNQVLVSLQTDASFLHDSTDVLGLLSGDLGGLDAFLPKEEYLAPRNAIEVKLVRIWKDLLECSSIGVRDSFFDLGGHSTLSIALVDRIHNEFNVELPIAAIFHGETIETLADLIQGRIDLAG